MKMKSFLFLVTALMFFSCAKELSYENDLSGGNGNTATYSYYDGTGNCISVVPAGNYVAGSALTAANTITLSVDVATAGSWSASTTTVNGISFFGSGTFVTTGLQSITLTGSGTPVATGTYSYQAAPNGCTFTVTVTGGGGGSNGFLRCKIDGVLTNFNTNLTGYNLTPPNSSIPFTLSAQGTLSDVANSPEELWVNIQNPTALTTGDYNNLSLASNITDRGCQVAVYPTGFPNLYWGTSALSSNTFTVKLTSYTSSGAAGTFSGTLYENNGIGPATKQITEGEFQISF